MATTGRTPRRLGAVRAFLAGAAILAGGLLCPVHATEETAIAIPRIQDRPGAEVALPRPLPPSAAARVRRIFALQARGQAKRAQAETARLRDKLLLGDILAARYLAPDAKPGAAALRDWLKAYADLPEAPAIRAALRKVLPSGASLPKLPEIPALSGDAKSVLPPEESDPVNSVLQRSKVLDREVRDRLDRGATDTALRLIRDTKMSRLYGAALRTEVARTLFAQGKDRQALSVGEGALRESDGRIGTAGFVAGLAAWRLGEKKRAGTLFARAADAAWLSPEERAGAAFWAARARLLTGDVRGYRPWMRRAAASSLTFYGILARRVLGRGVGFSAERGAETLGEADVAAVDATKQGHRAFALLQVGQKPLAEQEFRRLWGRMAGDPGLARSLMLVARRAGMSDLAAQLATLVQAQDGLPRDALRFPLPKLHPLGGFRIDPALVYGLARVESNFDPGAVSPAGARGLMQLTAVAARAVAGGKDTKLAHRLLDPSVNLRTGQLYLELLAQSDTVDGDLIRLLASYNAGPSRLAQWVDAKTKDGDPLLFIESIPVDETRAYVKRALAYSWIYAARLHLPAPGLDELAAGSWPRFKPLAEPRVTVAPPATHHEAPAAELVAMH